MRSLRKLRRAMWELRIGHDAKVACGTVMAVLLGGPTGAAAGVAWKYLSRPTRSNVCWAPESLGPLFVRALSAQAGVVQLSISTFLCGISRLDRRES